MTSVARTLVDLADVLTQRRLADAIHEAEVQRRFDLVEIQAVLDRVPGRTGEGRLRRVLAAYDAPALTRSEAERRFLDLCAANGLPRPETNVSIARYEVDFLWRRADVAVEVDGAAAHHTRRAFHADRRRDRVLAAHGIHVLRITWRDLTREPRALAEQLAAILARR